METGRALLAVGAAAAVMGLQRQPLAAATEVLGGGFDVVLPPVADTLATQRSAVRRARTTAKDRAVSFSKGVHGDARECRTRLVTRCVMVDEQGGRGAVYLGTDAGSSGEEILRTSS